MGIDQVLAVFFAILNNTEINATKQKIFNRFFIATNWANKFLPGITNFFRFWARAASFAFWFYSFFSISGRCRCGWRVLWFRFLAAHFSLIHWMMSVALKRLNKTELNAHKRIVTSTRTNRNWLALKLSNECTLSWINWAHFSVIFDVLERKIFTIESLTKWWIAN